jgi:hypothetical protein
VARPSINACKRTGLAKSRERPQSPNTASASSAEVGPGPVIGAGASTFIDLTSDFVTVVEIKSTDWDQIQPRSRPKLLASHRRQVLRYVDKYLDEDRVSVCAGIIYPAPPADPTVRVLVEEYLNGYALQVVWYDEPIRANTKHPASV